VLATLTRRRLRECPLALEFLKAPPTTGGFVRIEPQDHPAPSPESSGDAQERNALLSSEMTQKVLKTVLAGCIDEQIRTVQQLGQEVKIAFVGVSTDPVLVWLNSCKGIVVPEQVLEATGLE
jgi:hypothetical protein